MDLHLKDQVVVITGGASGIGRATAEYFRREGARLVLGDAQAPALKQAVAELRDAKAEVLGVHLDVRDYATCERMVSEAILAFDRIDVLVNCAGIGGIPALFAENQPSDWSDLIAINLLGVMHCCRAVIDRMIAQRSGRIVNIASEAGKGNEKRIVAYGATKGGVISLTRGLAVELGRYNITVNAVCPGVTRTPMTSYITADMEREWKKMYPLGRLGQVEDIAPLIVFLASTEASWITGQAISVSGGFGRS